MIARKITYTGTIDTQTAELIFDIVRKIEITGEVKHLSPQVIELDLEGDPSMIKLVQHQVERRASKAIQNKTVAPIPFQQYVTVNFVNFP